VPQIKGTAIRARLDYLAEKFGETGRRRVLDTLGDEHRAQLENGVLLCSWYPLELSDALLDAAERVLGKSDGAICRAIGRASARKGLTSTYALFATQAQAVAIADKMERTTSLVWRSYYDVGEFHTRATGASALESELTGVTLTSRWLCQILVGYIAGHVEVLGGVDVTVVHASCVLRGKPRCVWEATWR
jgi:predicted hydrocarbon binding protein